MTDAEKDDDTAGKKAADRMSDKERTDKGQVLARVVIEVLGAPKEYVEEAIQLVIDKVHRLEDVDVVSESTYEAEEKDKLFTTFSEIEVWFKNMDVLTRFMFDFTPSSVEIMQPAKLHLDANFISGFLNDFLLKMHDLGLKLKDTSAKVQLVQKNTDVLLRNFVHATVKEPRSSEDISKITGIPKPNVEAMLGYFIKAGIVEKSDDKYGLKKKG